ncbi:MAG TPA: hypothetical protein VLT84_08735 [Acidobacteriota bacterium]|nr:hypothetical protein [Acidobacteriota bacterium]
MTAGSVARVRLGGYRFAFRVPWPSAEGPRAEREGILLALEDDEGRIGVGESAPFPGFAMETPASSLSALRLAAKFAIGLPPERFLEAAADLPRLAPVVASPGARAAIDLALHDLAAQRAGVPLARFLGGDAAADHVHANATIARVPPGEAGAGAAAAVAAGARCLKLKVGGRGGDGNDLFIDDHAGDIDLIDGGAGQDSAMHNPDDQLSAIESILTNPYRPK